jgi:hypothetical protein
MIGPDPIARWHRVEAWLRHAEDDARIGLGCLRLDPPARGGAAYHCQQAAEKLLKGFLVQAGLMSAKHTTWIRWSNQCCRISRGCGPCWQP